MDSSGNIYFVDAHWQTIYRWSAATRQLSIVRDNPLDPVQLFFDKAGDLMVISYAGDGTVYSFKPDAPDDNITLLKAEPSAPRPGMTPILPVSFWRNENDFLEAIPAKKPYQYVSPDGAVFLPAGKDFVSGELYYGSKLNDLLRAFGVGAADAGQPYLRFRRIRRENLRRQPVGVDGSISNLKLFAEQGGESLAVDDQGNVYIAAGQIFVYNPAGESDRHNRCSRAPLATPVRRRRQQHLVHSRAQLVVCGPYSFQRSLRRIDAAKKNLDGDFWCNSC